MWRQLCWLDETREENLKYSVLFGCLVYPDITNFIKPEIKNYGDTNYEKSDSQIIKNYLLLQMLLDENNSLRGSIPAAFRTLLEPTLKKVRFLLPLHD